MSYDERAATPLSPAERAIARAAAGETPLSQDEQSFHAHEAAATTIAPHPMAADSSRTSFADLPQRAQLLLRIVSQHRSISHAALTEKAYPCATIRNQMDALLEAKLVSLANNDRTYKITEAGAALCNAAAPTRPAEPRSFFRTESYDGSELRNNSTRPGAYMAMRLPSLGGCDGARSAA